MILADVTLGTKTIVGIGLVPMTRIVFLQDTPRGRMVESLGIITMTSADVLTTAEEQMMVNTEDTRTPIQAVVERMDTEVIAIEVAMMSMVETTIAATLIVVTADTVMIEVVVTGAGEILDIDIFSTPEDHTSLAPALIPVTGQTAHLILIYLQKEAEIGDATEDAALSHQS